MLRWEHKAGGSYGYSASVAVARIRDRSDGERVCWTWHTWYGTAASGGSADSETDAKDYAEDAWLAWCQAAGLQRAPGVAQ